MCFKVSFTCVALLILQTTRINTIKLRTSTISALETSEVVTVTGHQAVLPCDLSPPATHANNSLYSVYLVLWYREDQGEPLYSYDARDQSWNQGSRWSDEFQFGDRAYFDLERNPAALIVDKINPDEAGIYRCRVDFKSAPTRNTLVNVSLIEPPRSLTIIDFSGNEIQDIAGPYTRDTIATLTCVASGGNPSPQVTWWREHELVDSSYERTYQQVVQNSLRIGPLAPRDLGHVYTCMASNNNVSAPASRRVTVDMVFPPTDVSILTIGQPLVAGTTYLISCEAAGSRPDPGISWWLDGDLMKEETDMMIVEKVKDVTKSTIYFTPSIEDNGKMIGCRAENKLIPDSGIDDSWTLTVYYPPRVNISFGVAVMSLESVKQGQDLFFKCSVMANPKAYKIGWRHQNKTLAQDIGRGILISDTSLVLQKVTKEQAGEYSCFASNLEGDTESLPLAVRIKYPPACNQGSKSTLGANIGDNVTVKCSVDAYPAPTSFSWSFNNSKRAFELTSEAYEVSGVTSSLVHAVHSDHDYGQYHCSAANSEGQLTGDPCVVSIIPAQPPTMPTQCSLLNQTTELLQVECEPGFDGGLDQRFVLEVVDGLSMVVLANVTSVQPQFTVTGLHPGREIKLVIVAENTNGRSQPVIMDVFTTKVAQLQVESPVPLQFTPFVGILAGIVVTFIIIILTVIIVIKIKYKYTKSVNNPSEGSSDQNSSHYKSFKFDSVADKKYLKAEYGSESSESGSPMSVLSEEEEGSSPRCSSTDEDHYCDTKNVSVSIKSGVQLQARLSPCDTPHSWTPFLARNCEESVI